MSLRIQQSTDAALIHRLTIDAWANTVDARSSGHRLTVADVDALFAAGAVGFVAFIGSEPVGSVIMKPRGTSVSLMKLAVPAARGQGVASALIEAGVAWASAQGADEVVLAVSLMQPQLAKYYARRGFVADPTRLYPDNAPGSYEPIMMIRTLTSPPLVDVEALAAQALQQGQLVVLPTETVYGLGALASDSVAVRRVFATKGRPVDHPLIVHIANRHALPYWAVNIPDDAWRLAEQLWPGPLTLVLDKHPDVPSEVTGGLATVAVRVPAHAVALGVLGLLPEGAGIAAPSANRFGRVSPTTAAAAHGELDSLLVPGDMVLDGGPCSVGVESTIVDLTTSTPTILRPGGLDVARIEAVLGRAVERVATGPSRAPGMLASHYAPQAGVRLTDSVSCGAVVADLLSTGSAVGVLAPASVEVDKRATRLAAPAVYDGAQLAPILYERLRDADRLELDVLVVVMPADDGLGWAVNDRLRRASH